MVHKQIKAQKEYKNKVKKSQDKILYKLFNDEDKKCPYCNSEKGYYVGDIIFERFHFSFDGKFIEHEVDKFREGLTKYCISCKKCLSHVPYSVIENENKGHKVIDKVNPA